MNKGAKQKVLLNLIEKLPEEELTRILQDAKLRIKQEMSTSKNDFYSMSGSIKQKLILYKSSTDPEQRKWVETIKSIPKALSHPESDIKYLIRSAESIWESEVCGQTAIRDKLILHMLEYAKVYHTRPIIFIGTPGCGKTHISKTYMKMMGVKNIYVNCSQTAHGHGLYGETQSYREARQGILLDAAIQTGTPNPGILFDEIDKSMQSPNYTNLQNDLLPFLDESREHLIDNYCGVVFNASEYVPVFTANNEDDVSQPLKDRCEIIYIDQPNKEQITNIITTKTLPQLMKQYELSDTVDNNIVSGFINKQYNDGIISLRKHQAILENALSNAYLRYIRSNEDRFELLEEDFNAALSGPAVKRKIQIGFR